LGETSDNACSQQSSGFARSTFVTCRFYRSCYSLRDDRTRYCRQRKWSITSRDQRKGRWPINPKIQGNGIGYCCYK
jgi:hypothetical protein